MIGTDDFLKAALIGVGGTVVLDLWAWFMAKALKVPPPSWPMVGRWIGNMPRGKFVHASMASARPVHGEAAIGWTAHYVIGIGYGLLLLAVFGRAWVVRPTLLPPLFLSWVLLVAPYFVMMPGMGAGVAGAKTPKPVLTCLKSVAGHSIFGLGMYATAQILTAMPST
ncbi:DUF2938 domain-containing protein [Pseudomonas aeruginosa]